MPNDQPISKIECETSSDCECEEGLPCCPSYSFSLESVCCSELHPICIRWIFGNCFDWGYTNNDC